MFTPHCVVLQGCLEFPKTLLVTKDNNNIGPKRAKPFGLFNKLLPGQGVGPDTMIMRKLASESDRPPRSSTTFPCTRCAVSPACCGCRGQSPRFLRPINSACYHTAFHLQRRCLRRQTSDFACRCHLAFASQVRNGRRRGVPSWPVRGTGYSCSWELWEQVSAAFECWRALQPRSVCLKTVATSGY